MIRSTTPSRWRGSSGKGPLRQWAVGDIVKDKLMRFAQTYLLMAHAGYRPAAPSDGFGNIQLSLDQCKNRERLYTEAIIAREEDGRSFNIGCSNYSTNRAFVLCIEAARLLAGGGDTSVVKLLKMAIRQIGDDGE